MLAGQKNENIRNIKAFIKDKVYDAAIRDEDFYIVMTPVVATKLDGIEVIHTTTPMLEV